MSKPAAAFFYQRRIRPDLLPLLEMALAVPLGNALYKRFDGPMSRREAAS